MINMCASGAGKVRFSEFSLAEFIIASRLLMMDFPALL
ncbi:hypothetical protein CEV33_1164 [Brucella grignonensis]|uniref:Uncharacterized protein n=1 Tax=Brucella grignonensis TaxID=94627 RepID=A0A256FCB7_9HYPH|nr:hypothetical protein CEV33_1164 [Brucella grignonensis]